MARFPFHRQQGFEIGLETDAAENAAFIYAENTSGVSFEVSLWVGAAVEPNRQVTVPQGSFTRDLPAGAVRRIAQSDRDRWVNLARLSVREA